MQLYPFQQAGVDFLKSGKRVILGDEPGLGKTAQALKACQTLSAKRVLVVCPNSLKIVWAREIEKWTGDSYTIITGPADKRLRQFLTDEVYTIVNYEALRLHAAVKQRSAHLVNELDQDWDVLILDEVTRIANRKSQVAKVVKAVAKRAKLIYALTGTPILNKATDLWPVLNILDSKRFSSYWRFAQRYCDIVHNGYGYQVLDITDADDLRTQQLRHDIAPYILRRLKKDVFSEMPAKTVQHIWVDLAPSQQRVYQQMEAKMLAVLSSTAMVYAPVVIAQITRLKQIVIDPNLMIETTSLRGAKIDALFDILASCAGHKVVIFSQFVKALKRLSSLLTHQNIDYAMLTGELTGPTRQRQIDRFQTDSNCPVFLCQTKTGGLGLTLTAASIAIFLDKLWTPALNEQAQDRIHRLTQTEPVTIYEILARDTIEEDIEELLSQKQHVSDITIELLDKLR